MLFRQLFDQTSSTYTYLLADEASKKAVLIDPVFEQHARDTALVRELGLELLYTLDTHCHADHVTGAWLMKAELGSKIALASVVGADNVDVPLNDGDKVEFGGCSLTVVATPGHTDGCLTFITADKGMAFTGDALLIRGAGRTDFQQGSASRLFHSIRDKIFALPSNCNIYPAHDYSGRTMSSVSEEREHNPRVGGDATERDFCGYMENLGLPHPKKIDVAVPANMVCGKPADGQLPRTADWGPVTASYAGTLEIDADWVAQHRDDVHIVDVRSAEEIAGDLPMIDGAQHIPINELRDHASEVPSEKPVVTVCHSGKRSALAMLILKKAGNERVANLSGGMLRWHETVVQAG